jgi:ssDNA-binding Zn-finger/Zn-ribbon topoisomerase 1
MYPEHKETRELPGADGRTPGAPEVGPDGTAVEPAAAEVCPKCGEAEGGVLVQRRGRFGPFMGCSRYPECDYIKKEGPPPPDPLAFDVACPTCKQGKLVTRRARRTGSLFWGCSRYPKCRYTTSHEPVGAIHDGDGAPIGKSGGAALCLVCGAAIELPAGESLVGRRLVGGAANPAALARPTPGRAPRRTRAKTAGSSAGSRSSSTRKSAAARAVGARDDG